ncbi:MAG: amidophosphoribosyltransferase [bacterium]|nr:amidophosphoribosyltransferase [bacterium]
MCGIIGVIGSKTAAAEIYFGLVHQQHRGQDAAGMIVCDNRGDEYKINIVKDKGLVPDVFNAKELHAMKGNMGIGHVRYPTVGTCEIGEVQPLFLHYPNGIGMAFNGNIVNYLKLKKRLKDKKRRYLSSGSDGEVLLNIFADNFSKKETIKSIFDSVQKVQEQVVGAYSVIALIANKGILAFKDPNGIKPLILGERKNGKKSYAFASESIALTMQGYNNLRDLKPGEVVFIDKNMKVHSKILKTKKHAHCVFEWVYFSAVESVIEGQPVYTARCNLGRQLAEKVKRKWPDLKFDYTIPVPDTSRPAANALAIAMNVPYGEGLVKNRYVGRTFIMPLQKVREEAMKLKLRPIDVMLKGKKIMIVDDSIVRGTTSKKMVKLLRGCGVDKVCLLSTFPPIKHPCYYGIDFQHEDELVAHNRTIKEVEKVIGADRLVYMDVEGLKKAVGKEDLCMACLTGKYPTPIKDAKELEKLRRKDQSKIKKSR